MPLGRTPLPSLCRRSPLARCFHSSRRTMAPPATPLPQHVATALGLKPGEAAFREGSATIAVPSKEAAFLNPVQQFNRDLSTLAIRTWAQVRDDARRQRFEARLSEAGAGARKKRRKNAAPKTETSADKPSTATDAHGDAAMADGASTSAAQASTSASEQASSSTATEPQAAPAAEPAPEAEAAKPVYQSQRFTIFEALSATGLRSIRYAREVPLLKWVLANDLSASAAAAMRRNVALNFPAGRPIKEWQPGEAADAAAAPLADEKPADQEASTEAEPSTTADAAAPSADASAATDGEPQIHKHCRVRVNEGDATDVLYTHRAVSKRFDVIDLDPYGSAVPFLDGAVQAVADGGLLCVTCTDLAVLAGSGHPEKAFSSYGGTVARVDYCHEVALRLVLHSIASAAARYGRTITPLLSLSIDFYVRVFVRVESKPIEVKRLACSTGTVSTCNRCGNFEAAPLGRERPEERGGQKFQPGYAASVGSMCKECGGQARFVVAGPMWLGPLHDQEFCRAMLATLEQAPERFQTAQRIRGMVGMAAEELQEPFYFVPSRVAGLFHCENPTLIDVVSALLHAGHEVSRSHCQPGSLKTTASRAQIFDLFRRWIELHPVAEKNIKPASPARSLIDRKPTHEFSFDEEHPRVKDVLAAERKGTKYQVNPLPHWGPGTAAARGGAAATGEKRKLEA